MAEAGPTDVRRVEDGELLGSVVEMANGRWAARAVFGGVLGVRDTAAAAQALVESDGLASLARRWFYRPTPADDWEVVLIQEAWPGRAVLVLGPYALPGTPTVEITGPDLEAGAAMTLEPPDDHLAAFATPRG
jgi:hypothetical protein